MELNGILDLSEITTENTLKDVIIFISKSNDPKYNLTKAAEELIELADVILKTANKKVEDRPPKQDIIDEIGDVSLRVLMIRVQLGITDKDIADRRLQKANKYLNYLKEKKFNAGI